MRLLQRAIALFTFVFLVAIFAQARDVATSRESNAGKSSFSAQQISGQQSGQAQSPDEHASTLTELLLKEDPARLAADVDEWGNPTRGAILFHQPQLQCSKCHLAAASETAWGPDLTKPAETLETDNIAAHVVESVLQPSKAIREGYETRIIATTGGQLITGVLDHEDDAKLVLRDPTVVGKLIEIPRDEIDEQGQGVQSAMPADLANLLTNRQQFLDLASYVAEVTRGGEERMRELQPAASLYALPPVPEYENNIDHQQLIAGLDQEAFGRGRQLYNRVCANCHGSRDREGSLPTSRKFTDQPLKAGRDPFAMYQTLTHGFGLMPVQRWMVPRQKYDVIHYIREEFLKRDNPSEYAEVNDEYLARLPAGTDLGPEPSKLQLWSSMDYGPSLTATYESSRDGSNIAQKGIAIRLDPGPGGVARGAHWMIFEHDTLRASAGWSGEGFVDWTNVMFDGQHGVHSHTVGELHFANPTAPGWADPLTDSFDDDARVEGRDGKRYGPLPKVWGHYRGQYRYGDRVILSYSVGDAEILEMPGVDTSSETPVFLRTFNIGPRSRDLTMIVADAPLEKRFVYASTNVPGEALEIVSWGEGDDEQSMTAGVLGSGDGNSPAKIGSRKMKSATGETRRPFTLHVPAGEEPLRFTVFISHGKGKSAAMRGVERLSSEGLDLDLSAFTEGGPAAWPEEITTQAAVRPESADGPFIAENLTHPEQNPWLARTRFTGFDFYPDGDTAAVSAWDGDVWLVRGLSSVNGQLAWRRIASGLFQPLGVKIVDERIYVTCRDQLVILNDLNGDGETDFYENFNSDHQVTEHFHEFAMGLQTDDDGNFYYAKSARHALQALVPHHGTLLRVSADGRQTEVLATGFRAANGVCLNPDGTFYVTDQEGHWIPKNRINKVREGGFYGNIFGYTDVTDTSDSAMEQPMCWITNAFDRSPAELLWVPEDAWGPVGGALLNLSYGYGKVFIVPHETVNGQIQGGMSELPIPQFPTGLCRGRFHPQTGDLYTCGMFAWAGDQTDPGGFYRIRYNEKPVHAPLELRATHDGLELTFSEPLDRDTAQRAENYSVKVWALKRTANYGSEHIDEHAIEVDAAVLDEDGQTVRLSVPEIAPTWSMEIRWTLKDADGKTFSGVIHNTIHNLQKE